MQRTVVVVVLYLLAGLSEGWCPKSCDDVRCITDLTQADCDQLTAMEGSSGYSYGLLNNASFCNCCPGCYRFAKENIGCSSTQLCKPGLKCSKKSATCIVDKKSCNYQLTSDTAMWKPSCDNDGVYSRKQCKGEQPIGRCFCNNATGGRVFGQEWWAKAENMTCACSRRVSELQSTGRLNVTLHCDQYGNYEQLQCDSGVCWCAEPKTGKPTSQVVPAILMPQLTCYNATAVGKQYLRQCESQYIAVVNIREELRYHGTTMDTMTSLNCDRDGSFASVQVNSNQVYCKSPNNTLLSGQGEMSDLSSIDCNCARDQLYFTESGMGTLPMTCQSNGNYANPQYDTDQKGYCVDSDGCIIRYLTQTDYDDLRDYATPLCEDDPSAYS